MKIVMFGWEFPPAISGGLGTACEGIARGLVDEGIAITLVLPHVPTVGLAGIDFLQADGVAPLTDREQGAHTSLYDEFEELIEVDSCIHPYFSENEYQFQKARVLALDAQEKRREFERGAITIEGMYGTHLHAEVSRFARAGFRLGVRGGFDIVYVHDWMTMLAGVEASYHSGAPLVVHMHSTEYDRAPYNPQQHIIDIERYGMEKADCIITVSYRSKDMIARKYSIDPNRIAVVHNALTPCPQLQEEYTRQFHEKIILFMGRITEQKGPEYFIRAAKKVLQHNTGVRFVMAGCGDQLPYMIELVAAERMERHFHFTGFLRGNELAQMFSLCDVFVMPSVSEPFGITPLEAMAQGVPAIISNQSGVAEVLAHALKVDFWDIDAMASSMMEALKDPTFAEKGREEVRTLSWDQPAHKIHTLFKGLL